MACARHAHARMRSLLPPALPLPLPPRRQARGRGRSKEPGAGAGATARGDKESIPRALREQVWLAHAGRQFEAPCAVPWCANRLTAFDFHVGHDVPEARGGTLALANLKPLCARCNLSMGHRYTIGEWAALSAPPPPPPPPPPRRCWQALVHRLAASTQ